MNVLTHHNDTSRTGSYAGETVLSPGAVSSGKFTKLYERPVDGDVYAQVLYLCRLPGYAAWAVLLLVRPVSGVVHAA